MPKGKIFNEKKVLRKQYKRKSYVSPKIMVIKNFKTIAVIDGSKIEINANILNVWSTIHYLGRINKNNIINLIIHSKGTGKCRPKRNLEPGVGLSWAIFCVPFSISINLSVISFPGPWCGKMQPNWVSLIHEDEMRYQWRTSSMFRLAFIIVVRLSAQISCTIVHSKTLPLK